MTPIEKAKFPAAATTRHRLRDLKHCYMPVKADITWASWRVVTWNCVYIFHHLSVSWFFLSPWNSWDIWCFPDVSLRNISPSHLQISAVSLILLVFFSTLRGSHGDSVTQVGLLAPKEKLEGIDIAPDTRMHHWRVYVDTMGYKYIYIYLYTYRGSPKHRKFVQGYYIDYI